MTRNEIVKETGIIRQWHIMSVISDICDNGSWQLVIASRERGTRVGSSRASLSNGKKPKFKKLKSPVQSCSAHRSVWAGKHLALQGSGVAFTLDFPSARKLAGSC